MSRLVSFLASATGLSELDVRKIISRAPISYKHYHIEKRNGDKRLISQPAREVKALQRVLVRRLGALPVHDSATAYRTGTSIRMNAARHAGNGPIKKYDFSDFFHSILAEDWRSYCLRHSVFSEFPDIELSARLFFYKPPRGRRLCLAIGAPSSPWLSNVLLYDFDTMISAAVAKDHVTYTRYADDLTFSAQRTGYLNGVDRSLRTVIRDLPSPRLSLNEAKTVTATTKVRRMVTGLILADDGRVTIGRERKRAIRAALHRAFLGKNSPAQNAQLAGLLAFAGDVEPAYLAILKARYGDDLLRRLTAVELAPDDRP